MTNEPELCPILSTPDKAVLCTDGTFLMPNLEKPIKCRAWQEGIKQAVRDKDGQLIDTITLPGYCKKIDNQHVFVRSA